MASASDRKNLSPFHMAFMPGAGVEMTFIHQFGPSDTLLAHLQDGIGNLLATGSPSDFYLQRILVGHASKKGIERALQVLDPFFKVSNAKAQWIIGIDYDSNWVKTIQCLAEAHAFWPRQLEINIYVSPTSRQIMHPKLYWSSWVRTSDPQTHEPYDSARSALPQQHDVIIGSNNLSEGGARSNLELAIRFKFNQAHWETFLPPLKRIWSDYRRGPQCVPLNRYLRDFRKITPPAAR